MTAYFKTMARKSSWSAVLRTSPISQSFMCNATYGSILHLKSLSILSPRAHVSLSPKSGASSSLFPIRHILHLPVFLFQLPLHFKIQLALALDLLLLHVSEDAGVHCLSCISQYENDVMDSRRVWEDVQLDQLSAACAQR